MRILNDSNSVVSIVDVKVRRQVNDPILNGLKIPPSDWSRSIHKKDDISAQNRTSCAKNK